MRQKTRGILIDDNKLILIKRKEGQKIYYVFPGGSVENQETFEEALAREFVEELGIEIRVRDKVCEIINHAKDVHEIFYIVEYINGELGTGKDAKFIKNSEFKDSYEIVGIHLNELSDLTLLPSTIKDLVIDYYVK